MQFRMHSFSDGMTDRRYNSIDIAKGVCIFVVVITHYAWQHSERMQYLFPFWIDMAIPVFMIISGFVNAKSFKRKNVLSLGEAYSLEVVLGKIIRYSVPFIIVFVIEEVYLNVYCGIHNGVLQVFINFINGGYGPGSYYYPIMIQFVFFFPIIHAIILKNGFRGLIICGFINLTYEVLKSSYGMGEECYRLLVFRYTLLIAYGCYLAMDNYERHRTFSVVCFVVGSIYIILTQYLRVVPLFTNKWTGTSMWACMFLIPISAPLILNKAKNCFLERIGKASYHIFLVQMVYYKFAAEKMYYYVKNRILQISISIFICISVGIMFYFIETPMTKVINKDAYELLHRYKEKNVQV